jgi:hypothetical protein
LVDHADGGLAVWSRGMIYGGIDVTIWISGRMWTHGGVGSSRGG